MTEEVGKVIHDLYEELVEVRKQNVGLTNANKIYSKQNVEFRQNQDQDDLNRQITEPVSYTHLTLPTNREV